MKSKTAKSCDLGANQRFATPRIEGVAMEDSTKVQLPRAAAIRHAPDVPNPITHSKSIAWR